MNIDKYGKIEKTLSHLKIAQAEIQNGILLLNEILGAYDAQNDLANYRRSLFRFVEDDPTVLPFPGKTTAPLAPTQEAIFYPNGKTDVVGTPEEEQGFVYFTDEEILQMPKKIQKLIICNRKRCRIRTKKSGKNTLTYEIRYRRDGYNVAACGVTIELAKAKMIEKLKQAKPKPKEEDIFFNAPTNYQQFALYYCEKFRKPKVAEETYYKDGNRLNKHIFPVFGRMDIRDITPSHCQTFFDKLGVSKTCDECFSMMNVIFKGAIAHELIPRNPLAVVYHQPHESESGKVLTREEQYAFLDTIEKASPDMKILYALAFYTGLRPNELATATIEGDFIRAVNSKRKTKKVEYKRIYICKHLRKYLHGISTFPKLHQNYLSTEFSKHCPGHMLKDLRKTFNSRCKELGISDHARMHFMGHTLGKLGKAYTEFSDEYLLEEGKKLDAWWTAPKLPH